MHKIPEPDRDLYRREFEKALKKAKKVPKPFKRSHFRDGKPHNQEALNFIRRTEAQFKIHQYSAKTYPCYMPSTDTIEMPHGLQFKSEDDCLDTIFHELGHWTGSDTRLKRNLNKPTNGNRKDYNLEEIIAELVAMMLSASFQLKPKRKYDLYLAYVMQKSPMSNTDIEKCYRKAVKATEYLLEIARKPKKAKKIKILGSEKPKEIEIHEESEKARSSNSEFHTDRKEYLEESNQIRIPEKMLPKEPPDYVQYIQAKELEEYESLKEVLQSIHIFYPFSRYLENIKYKIQIPKKKSLLVNKSFQFLPESKVILFQGIQFKDMELWLRNDNSTFYPCSMSNPKNETIKHKWACYSIYSSKYEYKLPHWMVQIVENCFHYLFLVQVKEGILKQEIIYPIEIY